MTFKGWNTCVRNCEEYGHFILANAVMIEIVYTLLKDKKINKLTQIRIMDNVAFILYFFSLKKFRLKFTCHNIIGPLLSVWRYKLKKEISSNKHYRSTKSSRQNKSQ